MNNTDIAWAIVRAASQKFSEGAGNLLNHPWDFATAGRQANLDHERNTLNANMNLYQQIPAVATPDVQNMAYGGYLYRNQELKIGNCGERCTYGLYALKQGLIPTLGRRPNLGVHLNGPTINHDFIVLGATNILNLAQYSVAAPPPWVGHDIVICDPWHQDGLGVYRHGCVYPLTQWTEKMNKIIDVTIKSSSNINTIKNNFQLAIIGR
jgi:hypothetical protein